MLKRLDKMIQAFCRRLKKGVKPGFPRFRSKDRYDSLTFPSYGDGCRIKDNREVYLQGVGELGIKWHRQINGKVKTVTVRRHAVRWHVCLSVEYDAPTAAPDGCRSRHRLRPGALRELLSTGDLIPNPRWYKNAQKRLRRAQRKVDRSSQGIEWPTQSRPCTFSAYSTSASPVNDPTTHTGSPARSVDSYQLVFVEKLNIGGMSRGMLAKQVHDASRRSFLHKRDRQSGLEAGRRVVEVNPSGTSQPCLELTRFRGYLILLSGGGIHNATNPSAYPPEFRHQMVDLVRSGDPPPNWPVTLSAALRPSASGYAKPISTTAAVTTA